MHRYVAGLIEYLPVIVGAGATFAVGFTGVGAEVAKDLSDLLKIQSDMGGAALETTVFLGTLFGTGIPVELVKNAYMKGYYRDQRQEQA